MGLCFACLTASAQDAPAPAAPAPEAARVPPQVLELPPLVVPGGAEAVDAVSAVVVIDSEGRATLEETDASEALRPAVIDVIARGRFAPAVVDGAAVPARVRLLLRVAQPEAPPPSPPIDRALPPNPFDGVDDPVITTPDAPSHYQATGRSKPVPPAARRLELQEMRDVPGAFGDPFRVLDTMPGVVPVFSGLPYVYVRGAPPASTSYVYDDIAVPLLFHFGILNAVVHPAMLGDLLFYTSVAPARFGRKTGGVFGAEGPERLDDALHGEVELRLIDVSAMLNVPIGQDTHVFAAARYGYPGAVASLLADDFTLSYWDYQLRLEHRVGARDRFVLTWFGSYDKAGEPGNEVTITFHRAEARLLHTYGHWELGSALQLGFDQTASAEGDNFSVRGARLGPRMWLTWRASEAVRLRVGADMLATAGEVRADFDDDDEVEPPTNDPDRPTPMNMDEENNEPLVGDPISQNVKGRNMIGAYGELALRPSPAWELALGLRADLWLTGSRQEQAMEPRAIVTYHPTSTSDLYAAAGLSHQPAVFPIPIPGLADIVLDKGLQRAIQTEVGYRRELGESLRVETSLFFNHYSDLMFLDVIFDCNNALDEDACRRGGFPRSTSNAYGWEVFLKRDMRHTLSGWLSYTLGGATAKGPTGRVFTPETDVRHVGNLVLQWQLGKGWKLGLRAFYRSGRMASFNEGLFRAQQRLPGFFRGDVMLSDEWRTRWGRMRLSIEWFNVTFSREATTLECEFGDGGTYTGECHPSYAPALWFPNLGLRAQF